MKRILTVAILSLMLVTSSYAQFERKVFNHLGVNVGVGTEGIGVGVSAPLTNFLEFEAGVNFMPAFKLNGDLDLNVKGSVNIEGQQVEVPVSTVKANADFSRTTFNFKANVYPFGGNSKMFVAVGFSFGGSKIAKVGGHSDELQAFVDQYPDYKQAILDQVGVAVSDYDLRLNDNCSISGDIRCNSFRPYVGLGFGRLVPKNRVGFRVELGCQFMGKLKVYQDNKQLDINKIMAETSGSAKDDISKFIDNWKYYPVLKFQLVGRIL